MQKSADLKNLYYPFWVRAGGPSAREGRARARARARALSTPAFQGRTSESRLFCYVNLRSVSGKVVQFLEFGHCAKSKINSWRFGKVMSKTNFSLDLLRRNEQNNPEKMIGAHVPIKKSPHTVEQEPHGAFNLVKLMEIHGFA